MLNYEKKVENTNYFNIYKIKIEQRRKSTNDV